MFEVSWEVDVVGVVGGEAKRPKNNTSLAHSTRTPTTVLHANSKTMPVRGW